MENTIYISSLYDVYGELLTEIQKKYLLLRFLFKKNKVNRLSIGVQSFNKEILNCAIYPPLSNS